jgi:glutaredoxin
VAGFVLESKAGTVENRFGLANCTQLSEPRRGMPGLCGFPARFFTFLGNFSLESAVLGRYNPPVPDSRQVVIYSRKGCHLCEVVKESLVKLSRRGGFTWQEVDVDSDNELRRQFNDQVPVVFIDGRKAFKYRMDEREFLRKLAS